MYYLYILKSKVKIINYVGITNNLTRRLKEHNSGKSSFTKRYLPWDIIYTEELLNRLEARKREKYFKSSSGRKFLKNKIFKDSCGIV